MPLPTLAAITGAVVLTAMAAFQLLLAAGAPLGHMVWGDRAGRGALPAPLRIASVAAVALLGLATWTVLARAGLLEPSGDEALVKALTWAFVALFALNTVGNITSRSELERRLMAPVTLALMCCFMVVALVP